MHPIPTQNNTPHAPPIATHNRVKRASPPHLPTPASQRLGNLESAIPEDITERARKMLRLAIEWCRVNNVSLSVEDVKRLATQFDGSMQRSKTEVLTALKDQFHLEGENAAHFEALEKVIAKELHGSPKLNNTLKWLLSLEYLPSTIVMLFVTKNIYDEMEKRKQITADQNTLLFRQEMARQAVGMGLHFARTLISFSAVSWVTGGLRKHNDLRQYAQKISEENGLKKRVKQGLLNVADKMQAGWNHLYSDANQTVASVVSLMVMNVLTYGLTRPLMINAAFLGLNKEKLKKEAHNKAALMPKPDHVRPIDLQTDALQLHKPLENHPEAREKSPHSLEEMA